MPKFTKTYVDSLKTEAKTYEVWDTDLKGLGVMVHPSGRKTYYFVYRHKSPKKERLKVGIHGNISCEIAREIVKGWTRDLARGINPKDRDKKQQTEAKQSITLESFLSLFVEKHKQVHNKEGTIKRDAPRIKKIIVPFLGAKKISEINEEDILAFQEHLQATPIQFNRCNALLSKAFNLAELWGYRPKNSNPCNGIQKYPEKKKERFLNPGELARLEEILKSQETSSATSPYSLAAIRMLIYTGCRLGEILTLKWNDIFIKEGYIHLKDSKTGEKMIPLNESAKSIFLNLKPEKHNPYVFVGEKPGTCLTTLKRAWTKVRSLANLEDVRIHDLRHTFASLAIKQGVDLYTVSKLLGHKNVQTTTRYAHLEMKQLIKATNMVDQVWQGKNKLKNKLMAQPLLKATVLDE